MKISFHGACREVTGSCILVEAGNVKFLVDCGLFQGESFEKNYEDFSFDAREINFVLLTHAHLDHCGRFPKLYENGFRGKIYSTMPTMDLSEVIIADALKVSRQEGREPPATFFTEDDIKFLMRLFVPVSYGEERKVSENISVRLRDAGHILGSSIFEVLIKEDGEEKKLVFSGDLGNPPASIVNDPDIISGADVVFIESTYGDRMHESKQKGKDTLKQKILETISKDGVLIIPIFAVERTQEILYELNSMIENKEIPFVQIFLDSPLAIKVTGIYKKYYEFFDKEANNLINSGDDIFEFSGLSLSRTPEESIFAQKASTPKVILVGSGMFEGGRINSYLKRYLKHSFTTILIISFQTEGSLGRKLINNEKTIDIEGKIIENNAETCLATSFSSHGDQAFLTEWIDLIKNPKPKKIFVNHGEEESSITLARVISKATNKDVIVPNYGEIYTL
ncbi:MAG: MBL fold metallo-hydrolase [Candidatus Pacebacteria bacterium]|nr:MBL fold metallo-hydrolase [Candidatus Paceibacterota bacterium]